MRTVPSRIVTGTSRSTWMLNVSRGCHCTNPDPPVAAPVRPGHGVRYVVRLTPALERLKDRVRVQPRSAAAWDDPWSGNGRAKSRTMGARTIGRGGRNG